MRQRLHIGWLLGSIMLMLLAACSSSEEKGEKEPTTLTVYVYSPAHPTLIRAAVGPVNASAAEAEITKLQIWVFESGSGATVGYLETTETTLLNSTNGATFQLIVDDAFAQYKPDVDVYVLANLKRYENCDCSFNKNSTREEIRENAVLINTESRDYFGLTSPMTEVPGAGLPMVGVLKNQPVIGDAPVLRIGTQSHIANVSLERAISKMRFVFANTEGDDDLVIEQIKLDAEMIPNEEYLIPQTRTLTYNETSASLYSGSQTVVKVANPTIYIYDGQPAQTYETTIDNAGLTTIGPFYLRESDKQLKGTIQYRIGTAAPVETTFQMDAPGDFSRNRSWIIYAYHAGGGFLQLNALYVKDWTTKTVEHEIYNW